MLEKKRVFREVPVPVITWPTLDLWTTTERAGPIPTKGLFYLRSPAFGWLSQRNGYTVAKTKWGGAEWGELFITLTSRVGEPTFGLLLSFVASWWGACLWGLFSASCTKVLRWIRGAVLQWLSRGKYIIFYTQCKEATLCLHILYTSQLSAGETCTEHFCMGGLGQLTLWLGLHYCKFMEIDGTEKKGWQWINSEGLKLASCRGGDGKKTTVSLWKV